MRWEHRVLQAIRDQLDPSVLGGGKISSAGLPCFLFDANPASHGDRATVQAELQSRYALFTQHARTDRRLPLGTPLVSRWTMTYDIYSPKLRRFIEVDEKQHFSAVRLQRIQLVRPHYPQHFWGTALATLLRAPAVDRDPPHRDEARAYRDEARELLPTAYGLGETIRLDEYSLAQCANIISLIEEQL